MVINKFIDSITNKLFNKIRSSKSDAEARRLLKEHLSEQSMQADVIDLQIELEAIEFAEWLRTFEALDKMNGFWFLESQISSNKLYDGYLRDRERWRKSLLENKL